MLMWLQFKLDTLKERTCARIVVLYHPAGLSSSRWELLLWSGLMPPSHIRTGDSGTWILGWILKCKSGSTDQNDFWIITLPSHLDLKNPQTLGLMGVLYILIKV